MDRIRKETTSKNHRRDQIFSSPRKLCLPPHDISTVDDLTSEATSVNDSVVLAQNLFALSKIPHGCFQLNN